MNTRNHTKIDVKGDIPLDKSIRYEYEKPYKNRRKRRYTVDKSFRYEYLKPYKKPSLLVEIKILLL